MYKNHVILGWTMILFRNIRFAVSSLDPTKLIPRYHVMVLTRDKNEDKKKWMTACRIAITFCMQSILLLANKQ